MVAYINGIGIISPQKENFPFSQPLVSSDDKRLSVVEPNYGDYIDAKQIRRMSKITKMAIYCSIQALKQAGLEKPEGIIVGTALGCLEDTASFLKNLHRNKEEMLNPTPFIYSTHNTIASQVALFYQCRGYNSTYSHRNLSFENALLDAMLLLNEGPLKNILIGGIDELTDDSYRILEMLHAADSSSNSRTITRGEGSGFFILSKEKTRNTSMMIKGLEMVSFSNTDQVIEKAKALIKERGISKPDLLISGDHKEDLKAADHFATSLGIQNEVLHYKDFCGEYATSTAFALSLAASAIYKKSGNVILVHNHYEAHDSLILVAGC
jgi:3-oxoacyl-[acyl-carrier-protein] synthase II